MSLLQMPEHWSRSSGERFNGQEQYDIVKGAVGSTDPYTLEICEDMCILPFAPVTASLQHAHECNLNIKLPLIEGGCQAQPGALRSRLDVVVVSSGFQDDRAILDFQPLE